MSGIDPCVATGADVCTPFVGIKPPTGCDGGRTALADDGGCKLAESGAGGAEIGLSDGAPTATEADDGGRDWKYGAPPLLLSTAGDVTNGFSISGERKEPTAFGATLIGAPTVGVTPAAAAVPITGVRPATTGGAVTACVERTGMGFVTAGAPDVPVAVGRITFGAGAGAAAAAADLGCGGGALKIGSSCFRKSGLNVSSTAHVRPSKS